MMKMMAMTRQSDDCFALGGAQIGMGSSSSGSFKHSNHVPVWCWACLMCPFWACRLTCSFSSASCAVFSSCHVQSLRCAMCRSQSGAGELTLGRTEQSWKPMKAHELPWKPPTVLSCILWEWSLFPFRLPRTEAGGPPQTTWPCILGAKPYVYIYIYIYVTKYATVAQTCDLNSFQLFLTALPCLDLKDALLLLLLLLLRLLSKRATGKACQSHM